MAPRPASEQEAEQITLPEATSRVAPSPEAKKIYIIARGNAKSGAETGTKKLLVPPCVGEDLQEPWRQRQEDAETKKIRTAIG